jgi:rsbT antagonist protein RsbS
MADGTLPVVRIGPFMLVTLQGDLDDETITRIEDGVTGELARRAASGVLLDVSGLTAVDSFIARVLARLVAMVRLLGADAVVVGVRPAMAITLVELGLTFQGVDTALNAEQGMAALAAKARRRPRAAGPAP